MNKIVWILTCEYNDYDQHGEYFVDVFKEQPSLFLLSEAGVNCMDVEMLLSTGWTSDENYCRYHLQRLEAK